MSSRDLFALAIVLLVHGAPAAAQKAPSALPVRFVSSNGAKHVVIYALAEVRYTPLRLTNPDRFVFDIEGELPGVGKGLHTLPVGDPLLKQIRVAENAPGMTRVVLDLAQPGDYVAFRLTNPERLNIELRSKDAAAPEAPPNPVRAPVHFTSAGDVTRVTIDIPANAAYISTRLNNPDRILFDIRGALPKAETRDPLLAVGDTRLKQIRMVEVEPGSTRLVFDLAQPVEYTAARLNQPSRLLVELKGASAPPAGVPLVQATELRAIVNPSLGQKAITPGFSPTNTPVALETPVKKLQTEPETDAPGSMVNAIGDSSTAPEPQRRPEPTLASALVTSVPTQPLAPERPLVSAMVISSVPMQTPKSTAAGVQKIVPLQGADAINNIQTGSAVEPVVEVRDGRDLPVAGAEVQFQLPTAGPGGFFAGRTLALNTRTDEHGQAAGAGFTPNSVPGPFAIRVTAGSENQTASLVINQRNVTNAAQASRLTSRSRSLKWRIIGIAAGVGVTTGITLALHGGGSSSASTKLPNSVTVSTGPITIGGPH